MTESGDEPIRLGRPLRARRPAGPRRHGRRPHRPGPAPRAHRGHQAAAARPLLRRHVPGPVPPRGAVGGRPQPPLDRRGLRHRRRHGRPRQPHPVHRHGVRRGPDAARDPERRPQDPARARAVHHRRRPQRPRLQPPQRHHPPRHQARQRHADAVGPGQGHGLRHRPRHRRLLLGDDRRPPPSSARPSTSPPSRPAARPSTPAPTSTPPAACSTSCSPVARRSSARARSRWPTSTCARRPGRRRS